MRRRADRLARDVLGFEGLRPEQRRVVESVLEGRDTLAVMPTGSGKSATYQVAGLLLEGPTVVVSPLIALQKDQADNLRSLNAETDETAAPAVLNSTLSGAERESVLAGLERGEVEYLFLAPEQLANPETLARLAAAAPSLLVVDEAHCVSQWGHDFRPDYLTLAAARETIGDPVVLALTATASPPVRDEIAQRLGMREPRVIVTGFDRPNISLAARAFTDEAHRRAALAEAVVAAPKPGIIYAGTRAHAEEVAAALAEAGVKAAPYHAGLGRAARDETQESFMGDALEVVVATTAFGMGIDKPNVRFVHHLELSDSLDSYYQEIGRAGRDGEPAEALLFHTPDDARLRRFLTGGAGIEEEEAQAVLDALAAHSDACDRNDLAEAAGLAPGKLALVLTHLDDAGAVQQEGDLVRLGEQHATGEAAAAAADSRERQKEAARSRLSMMLAYADTEGCRREYLLNYFGEAYEAPCGNCDNCRSGSVQAGAGDDVPFPLGSQVRHASLGEGQVVRYEEGKVVVLFAEGGYQALALALVLERGLLDPV